ncbi:MAG: DUF111 family protein [Phycisphaeraceae bacterium]|nr:DUF111 family protein [Phycisphaeraceae bacterium]
MTSRDDHNELGEPATENAAAMPRPGTTDVAELAVNLDDVTGQLLGDVQQRLFEAGALDVWTAAIGMKKQRPGVMLCLLCETKDVPAMARRVIELTGSFGVRWRSWNRLTLEREHVQVDTAYGPVRVKVGRMDGQVVVARPEFEDVRALAGQAGVTVRQAMDEAQAAAQRWRQQETTR